NSVSQPGRINWRWSRWRIAVCGSPRAERSLRSGSANSGRSHDPVWGTLRHDGIASGGLEEFPKCRSQTTCFASMFGAGEQDETVREVAAEVPLPGLEPAAARLNPIAVERSQTAAAEQLHQCDR